MSVETMCCILETIILLYVNDALIFFKKKGFPEAVFCLAALPDTLFGIA